MSVHNEGSAPFDLLAILDALKDVEFIVVGGVAATLHGSPRVTLDLDIVPEASNSNIEQLARALANIEADVRDPARRTIPVSLDLLRGTATAKEGGQLRCRTRYGPIDILWHLHDGRGYHDLISAVVQLSDDERTITVVGIDVLIEIKQAADRPHDRQDVEYLKIIRERSPSRRD